MKCAALCLLFATCALAAVMIEPARRNEDHEGHCYTETYGLGAFEIDEKKRVPGKCALAECLPNGDISFYGCGAIKIAKPCMVLDGDLSKPYPDCCFQIKCYFVDDEEVDEDKE